MIALDSKNMLFDIKYLCKMKTLYFIDSLEVEV